jgi:hypothetical protein
MHPNKVGIFLRKNKVSINGSKLEKESCWLDLNPDWFKIESENPSKQNALIGDIHHVCG